MNYSVKKLDAKLCAGWCLCLLFSICSHLSFAQSPYINSIDKTSASVNETVTITGINFPTNLANVSVRFGAAAGQVTSTSENLIEAIVPAGATVDNISVINTANGLSAYSNEIFKLSFGGADFDAATKFDTQVTTSTGGVGAFDICMCDFNQDGLNDLVTTNQQTTNSGVNVFTNSSTNTVVGFTKADLNIGVESLNNACGDLDGDGLPDLIVGQGGGAANRFYIFRNTSAGAISFAAFIEIILPADGIGNIRSPRRFSIQDLDLDGKPELIVSNDTDNDIDVYQNTSSPGTISFASTTAPMQFTVTGAASTSGMDVKDLNNDGLPDIAVVADQSNNMYTLQNSSEPGTIAFLDAVEFPVNSNSRNLRIGDINNDGMNDVVMTSNTTNSILIFRNTTASAGAEISFFTTASVLAGVTGPWGLDLGDMDGDGDLDIIASSISTSPRAVYVAINTTTNPTLPSFALNTVSSAQNSRNIRVGDLNGDGKPDLAFTHRVSFDENGELSTIINRHCVVPTITPGPEVTVCNGVSRTLMATGTVDASYLWQRAPLGSSSFTTVETSANNFLIVNTAGTYRVTVLSDSNTCSEASNTVDFIIDNAQFITDPVASDDDGGNVICPGGTNTVQLSATSVGAGGTYSWTGPNNFTSTTQNPVLSSLTPEMSGVYTVIGEKDGCTSAPSTTSVVIESLPSIAVNNDGQDIFCIGSNVEISVTDFGSDYTYQWKKDGADIPTASGTTLTVSDEGNYSAVITSVASGCFDESAARNIQVVAIPTASFTSSVNDICVGLSVDFDASASMGQGSFAIGHTWDFGDGMTGTGETISHIFTTSGSKTVVLTVAYTDVTSCTVATSNTTINVEDPPVVDITTTTGSNEKCPSDDLRLSIADTFTNIVWSTGATESFIDVSDPGDFTVSAVNGVGCAFTSNTFTVANLANSGISISTTTHSITDGVIELAPDDQTVSLTVENATSPIWLPAEVIDNNLETSITVIPQDIRTEITVSGTDPNGCMEADTVVIVNDNIRAKKVFSPNGDGIGDECWEITNSRGDSFSQCTIFVFDSKGKNLLTSTGPFTSDCVWDGTYNGTPLPEGIYYYALKCSDSNISMSGTILLAR